MIVAIINLFVTALIIIFSFTVTAGEPTYQTIVKPPKIENKGIYLTAYTAGNKVRRAKLVQLIERTELNSVVIDVKDYSGLIFFDTNIPLVNEIDAEDIRIPDLQDWLAELKQKGIYTIARITVFQDPYLAEKRSDIALKSKAGGLWRDFKGLAWVDPTQKLVWDYNIDLAKEAIKLGFDEINFDYVRFPTDGNIKQMAFANLDNPTLEGKSEVMKEFYTYLGEQLKYEPALLSADLFGMVLWRNDGLNIGQRLADAALNFDFICPMVYPSHYPAGFEKFANPAEHPYEIVYRSLIRGKDVMEQSGSKLRPWLQDFDLGAEYTPEMLRLQKQAAYDAGANGWLMWNASNNYTEAGYEVEASN
ncbi:MAG: putative glycoside hydrolase [Candidatus Buchananbacteria bacterium]|nr:putative glycoside hydrolase [Candidatus Buchananbacteria bacterium]